MDEIDRILKNSSKAELLERLHEELTEADKVIVVIISDEDNEDGRYSSSVLTLGVKTNYEAYGILETAKLDLQADEQKR